MRYIRLFFICLIVWGCIENMQAQEDSLCAITSYSVEAVGSAATGTLTPFWHVSNRYGLVPLEAGNGYLRAGAFHQQRKNDFYWTAGLDIVGAAPRHTPVYIQQLYAEVGYKKLLLRIGSKERYSSLWDRRLSSGDMILSTNARPIPEVNLSIPSFMTIPSTKGWLHLKGEVAFGRSFDTSYLNDFTTENALYIKNILWHHKSLFLRLKDTETHFPLYATFGLRHIAQWGGTSTNPELGKQPQSWKDIIRVFFAQAGGEDASVSDQINVLGAHHISYDFQLGFEKKDWSIQAYYQHLSSDKSGLLFYNRTDGLWGVQVDLHRLSWINKIVFEYLETRNQSGSFHYINFDHENHPGRGGGGDDYYNNGEYTTGNTYFNRSIGSPLFLSPEYNEDHQLGFKSTRVKDFHFGSEGSISTQFSYRVLLTVMNGWGRHYRPFLKKKEGFSFMTEIAYTPSLSGWSFSASLSGDTGNIWPEESYGLSFSIRKQGILKKW